MKHKKNIVFTIYRPLAVFEHVRMEQGNKKGEILLPHRHPKTNMIIFHKSWSQAVKMQHTTSTCYAQITSLYSDPTYALNLSLILSGYFRITPGMQVWFWIYRQ